MSEIERAISEIKHSGLYGNQVHQETMELALQALREKAEREERMQWINDMNNPLEPIKVQSALDSEIMKYNYRKEHKPKDISVLDITIIYALNKVLEDGMKEGAE